MPVLCHGIVSFVTRLAGWTSLAERIVLSPSMCHGVGEWFREPSPDVICLFEGLLFYCGPSAYCCCCLPACRALLRGGGIPSRIPRAGGRRDEAPGWGPPCVGISAENPVLSLVCLKVITRLVSSLATMAYCIHLPHPQLMNSKTKYRWRVMVD